jgi:diguanylate cyclase (GGDEF)-like protein
MSLDRPKILIVDDSRIVRATLKKHIGGAYVTREEVDGQAGWEALLADPEIGLVISDLTMPRLDGYTFLERIRAADEARIRDLPVLLLSGDQDEASRARAKALGATDFIAKGIGTSELLARLGSAVELARTRAALSASRAKEAAGDDGRDYIEQQAVMALAHATRHGVPLTLLVIGLDGMDKIRQRVGGDVAVQIVRRFGQLLQSKIRREDSLGLLSDAAHAVVSPSTPASGGIIFARRLREAVEAASMSFEGKRLPLTVSIGLASCPPDTAATADGLLQMAAARMQAASDDGGNRVVGGSENVSGEISVPSLEHALRMIQAGRGNEIRDHAAVLAMQVMPLITLANRECHLDIRVNHVLEKLRERVQQTPGHQS